jgi:hypothetical protein
MGASTDPAHTRPRQAGLFTEGEDPRAPAAAARTGRPGAGGTAAASDRASPAASVDAVLPAVPHADVLALAAALSERHGDRLALGTSSWHFPGWSGIVWQRPYPAALLSSAG